MVRIISRGIFLFILAIGSQLAVAGPWLYPPPPPPRPFIMYGPPPPFWGVGVVSSVYVPPPIYLPPPQIVVTPAPITLRSQNTSNVRYFCKAANAYYPDVPECNGEWITVPVSTSLH